MMKQLLNEWKRYLAENTTTADDEYENFANVVQNIPEDAAYTLFVICMGRGSKLTSFFFNNDFPKELRGFDSLIKKANSYFYTVKDKHEKLAKEYQRIFNGKKSSDFLDLDVETIHKIFYQIDDDAEQRGYHLWMYSEVKKVMKILTGISDLSIDYINLSPEERSRKYFYWNQGHIPSIELEKIVTQAEESKQIFNRMMRYGKILELDDDFREPLLKLYFEGSIEQVDSILNSFFPMEDIQ